MRNSGIELNLGNNPDLLIVLKLGSSPRMIIHAYSQLSMYIGDAGFGWLTSIRSHYSLKILFSNISWMFLNHNNFFPV